MLIRCGLCKTTQKVLVWSYFGPFALIWKSNMLHWVGVMGWAQLLLCTSSGNFLDFPALHGFNWCQMLNVAHEKGSDDRTCFQTKNASLHPKFRRFVFLQYMNGFISQKCVGVEGSRQRELNQKRVDSRHKVISCPWCLLFFSLIFQRTRGDFTVTFSDSLVSHYMWVGARTDPSCRVVFAALSSAPVVSGQILSHVITVCLFWIAADNHLLTGKLGYSSSSYRKACSRTGGA